MTCAKASWDYLFKIIIIGDSYAGKSSILSQYWDEGVPTSFITTIGLDFRVKTVEINGKRIKLQVWDTAGQERFRTITKSYYRKAMGAILAYDVSDKRSFDHISEWMAELQDQTKDNNKQTTSAAVVPIIVGNKIDLTERQVETMQGVALAAQYKCKFLETSAKKNIGIKLLFDTLIHDIYSNTIPANTATSGTSGTPALLLTTAAAGSCSSTPSRCCT